MNKQIATFLTAAVFAAATTTRAPAQHPCSQKHPGHAKRIAQCVKDGDVKVCKGIAGHTVRYAVERFDIADLVGPEDLTRAANQMYDFMKWRLGSPTLVAAQYVTAGYQHFDKGYSDEAAAILMKVFDFKAQKPELEVPKWMQSWIEQQVGKSGEAIAKLLESHGVPAVIAGPLGQKIEDALANVARHNAVGMFVPKSFNVDNRLVEAAITARRTPAGHTPSTKPTVPTNKRSGWPFAGKQQPADRIAALERRVAELEVQVARLEGAKGGGDLAPAAGGYGSLSLTCHTWNQGRARVEVNGMLIAIFDDNRDLDLTPFLVPGRRNKVAMSFEPAKGAKLENLTATLSGTLPGQDKAIQFYSLVCAQGRVSDAIEFPVAPASRETSAARL